MGVSQGASAAPHPPAVLEGHPAAESSLQGAGGLPPPTYPRVFLAHTDVTRLPPPPPWAAVPGRAMTFKTGNGRFAPRAPAPPSRPGPRPRSPLPPYADAPGSPTSALRALLGATAGGGRRLRMRGLGVSHNAVPRRGKLGAGRTSAGSALALPLPLAPQRPGMAGNSGARKSSSAF